MYIHKKLDYIRRVAKYAEMYEPLDESHVLESHYSFFKCDHSRENFVTHHVRGFLPLKVVHFIMNMRTTTHAIFLSRYLYVYVYVY